MDKKQIGQFIAKCRKDHQLTQEQLAEMLDVTNKAVSKWENGICLPDPGLYESLCQILGIGIHELFAGKRESAAEKHLLQMLMNKLYHFSEKNVSFPEFDHALRQIAELVTTMKQFQTKEEAVTFWAREANAPREACSQAYDFYMDLFGKIEVWDCE